MIVLECPTHTTFSPTEMALIRDTLLQDQVIVYPTDTLYGLGADARSALAVAKLYALKERQDSPVSVLAADVVSLLEMTQNLSDRAADLIRAFLPGALTVICESEYPFAKQLISAKGTVGFRVPADGLSTELPKIIGGPITTTSVNPAGRPPATSRAEAAAYYADRIPLMLDRGPMPLSKGSTVIDLTTRPFTILREGEITRQDLEDFLN